MGSGMQREENVLFPVIIIAPPWFHRLFFAGAPLHLEHLEFYTLTELPLRGSTARKGVDIRKIQETHTTQ